MTTPTMKISYQLVAKLAGDVDKNVVQSTIMGVFNKIQEVHFHFIG